MKTEAGPSLQSLAESHGLKLKWIDGNGHEHQVAPDTVAPLMRALKLTDDKIGESLNLVRKIKDPGVKATQPVNAIMPTAVVLKRSFTQTEELHVDVKFESTEINLAREELSVAFTIFEEKGTTKSGTADSISGTDFRIKIPNPIGYGYHRLKVTLRLGAPSVGGKSSSIPLQDTRQHFEFERPLIITPTRCYLPGEFTLKQRLWGPMVNLTGLRTKRNWGSGDLTDLKSVVAFCAGQGAGVVAVSPLHAQVSYGSKLFTPRLPSHRGFISVLYIDVEAVEDFREAEEVKRIVHAPEFQKTLEELRQAEVAEVRKVGQEKLRILDKLYQYFRSHHLNRRSGRARDFRAFQARNGRALRSFATHQAIAESLVREGTQFESWHAWPEKYKDPHSDAVKEFVSSNNERIEFFEYIQWQADLQLKAIGNLALSSRLPLGLVTEVSPLTSRLGSEVWQNPGVYAEDLHLVEPSRPYLIEGHTTGAPPFLLEGLRKAGYAPFAQVLAASMRHSGAIRLRGISHWLSPVLTLEENSLDQACVLRQPAGEILGIIALESHRNYSMVIADSEDVMKDDDFNLKSLLRQWDIFEHQDVFNNEPTKIEDRLSDGAMDSRLLEPAPPSLAPLAAFWQGTDLKSLSESEQGLDKEKRDRAIELRLKQKLEVLRLLEKKELLPEGVSTDPSTVPTLTPVLTTAIMNLMARSSAAMTLFRLEDLGTTDRPLVDYAESDYPNWRVKLSPSFEELTEGAVTELVFDMYQNERGCFFDHLELADSDDAEPRQLSIPSSTYRLQFHKDFTFNDAAKHVDYLSQLGISHLYLSPILEARPGSQHGYDIINHARFNPELGTMDDFNRLHEELKANGMNTVIDLVPNHMGIGKHNPWWMDVLEHGVASEYAEYFDIDWSPIKKELFGKVLLPILGDAYGKVIEKGQLVVAFDKEHGRFTINYFEHELPLNPVSYPFLLGRRLHILNERLGANSLDVMTYHSILDALSSLPDGMGLNYDDRRRRLREFKVSSHRLAELVKKNPTILEFVEQNLKEFEAAQDDAAAVSRVHELLEKQAYRLSFWRVAAHEINYRRFFDINDLAGVRVEDPRAFQDMHDFVFRLVADNKVQGLRIDHPDGLFDPAGYFLRLQEEADHRQNHNKENYSKGTRQYTKQNDFAIYVLGEKILAPYERMEQDWLIHGTTGYDFLNAANGLLIDERNARVFNDFYERVINQDTPYEDLVYSCKHLIMETALASELNVLAHHLNQIAESSWMYRDFTLNALRYALSEVVAFFPVYRTYVKEGTVSDVAIAYIGRAVRQAKQHNRTIHPGIFDFIQDVLTLKLLDSTESQAERSKFEEAVLAFAMKFQQFTGPVMAKSLEDTLFYKYNRFVGLNEVGGEPNHFGLTTADFHFLNEERQRTYPYSMLASSTHDTKRSEDVRARLSVLSEIPDNWQERVLRWMDYNASKYTHHEEKKIPTTNDEYLIYQTLVGTYPLELNTPEEMETYSQRIEGYVIKALRESKENTSWMNQDHVYEQGVTSFIRELLRAENVSERPDAFFVDFLEFHQHVSKLGLVKSLTQTLLKLTCPGVPDFYQGNELFDFSLVDPDNRRPVDFNSRSTFLKGMQPFVEKLEERSEDETRKFIKEILKTHNDGRIKLYLTARVLNLRKEFPDLFTVGKYVPIGLAGEGKDHFVAYAREHRGKVLIVLAPTLVTELFVPDYGSLYKGPDESLLWTSTKLTLPRELQQRNYTNVLTGEKVEFGERRPRVRTLLDKLPIALLFG